MTEDTVLTNRPQVTGTVNLILCDGKTLTAPKGIQVPSGKWLKIWAQSEGTGKLIARTEDRAEYAAIGGSGSNTSGKITINGGIIDARNSGTGAAIGAGYSGNAGNIVINNGNVYAEGCPGIGGGQTAGFIAIWGGDITAVGGDLSSAVGSGGTGSPSGMTELQMHAGVLTATAGLDKNGDIIKVQAIGSGDYSNYPSASQGKITLDSPSSATVKMGSSADTAVQIASPGTYVYGQKNDGYDGGESYRNNPNYHYVKIYYGDEIASFYPEDTTPEPLTEPPTQAPTQAPVAQPLTVSPTSATVYLGNTKTLTAKGNKGALSFKSSDTSVATVSSKGVVTPKKAGDVKITVTAAAVDNYKKTTKTVTITVKKVAAPTISKIANVSGGVKLTYNKPTGARAFRIFCKTGSSTSWKAVGWSTGTTFTAKTSDGKTALKSGTKYTFTVRCVTKSGSATYTGGYNKTGKAIFYAKTPAISKVTNPKSKTATVTWKSISGVTGYQIQASLKSDFSSPKTVKVAGASKTSGSFSGLTKGKVWYFRMRTCVTKSGKTCYSAWSGTKSLKITK